MRRTGRSRGGRAPRGYDVFSLAVFLLLSWAIGAWAQETPASIEEALRLRVAALPAARTGNGFRDIPAMIRDFYTAREFRPLWVGPQGPTAAAAALQKVLDNAAAEGLDPEDYRLPEMEAGPSRAAATPQGAADWEIRCSQTFLTYAVHLARGRFDPEREFFQWVPYRRPADPLAALAEVGRGTAPEAALAALAPRHPSYGALKERLEFYRRLAAAGPLTPLPPGKALKKGSTGPRVAALKNRLLLLGDLNGELLHDPEVFDGVTDLAVRRFQWRHGLKITGIVDKQTLASLNADPARRVRQLEINLERWRWYPDDFGSLYVMVIIPDFWLFVVEDWKTVLSMKTVVGTAQNPSPIFNDTMTYLELNPPWNIPASIVEKEMIPSVLKDPDFLKKKRIRIYRDWSEKAREIDPAAIDWRKVNPEKFPYRMVQDPGVNPLGRIKFMFPNSFDVYLHDTTQRYLFNRHRRMFSHGCIRVEKPYELALWVLKDNPGWSRERLMAEIGKRKRQVVTLTRTVPVHVLYLTAWVDGHGVLQFREDIYGYDAAHEAYLKKMKNRLSGRP